MKKVVVGIAALTLLITGCAQSTEDLFDEVIDLCVESHKLTALSLGGSEENFDADHARDNCVSNLSSASDDRDKLLQVKQIYIDFNAEREKEIYKNK